MLKRIALLATLVAPLAAAQSFQPGRLPAMSRDSFEVVYQGQPFGSFVMEHAKAGDNVTLVTDTRLPQMGMVETDSMVFNATTLAPVMFSVAQTARGMTVASGRITMANGKASGSMQQRGRGGMQTLPVDAAIATGVIVDGTDALLIPTIDFSDALSLNFQTFDGKTGKVKNYVLKVLGKESVTVPAGTYDAWKTEITSDGEVVQIWVSTAEPRKLLMLRVEAQQLEMKRASK